MSRYRMTQGSFTLFSALALLVLLAQPVTAQSHLPLKGQQPPAEKVAVRSGPDPLAAPLTAPYYSGLAPTAVDDSGAGFTTDEDTPFILDDVLANDSDPESDLLTVQSYDASGLLGLLTWTSTPAGSLDTTFSGDGLLTTDFGSGNDYASGMALQADGKIVAAGYASNGSNRDFALARYNSDGSLDTTFSGDGLLTTAVGSGNDEAYAVAVQPDGKVVAAGYAFNGSYRDFALARYNPDGSLDTTFSGDGLLTTNFGGGSNDYAYAVALQPDGKIVAAGYGGSSDFALARYNPDGSLDTTFNGDGLLTTAVGSSVNKAYALALQADGKIVATGFVYNSGNYDFALVRYNPDGSLDTTLSDDGMLTTNFGSGNDFAYAVAVQADGKIVAAGYAANGSNNDFALARYNPDGSLDTIFSSDGLLTTAFGSSDDYAYAVALQSDGKIVAAGYAWNGSNYDFALARYNPDGSLDTTFSSDGLLTTAVGSSYDHARAVALQPDGKILAAGYTHTGSNSDFALARYTMVDRGSFAYNPNGQFEGLANGETAVETFSYVASDGALTDTATVTLTINGLNDAPVLTAIGNQSGYPLTTISFAAAASDPDLSNTLTFSLDAGAPDGAVIDPASGAFTWTLTEAQGLGVYPVTVRVTDNGSPALNDFEAFAIEVGTAPTAVDDSGAGFTTDEDTPFILDDVLTNDTDPEDGPLTVLSYDASGLLGQLTWTPVPADSLDITFSGDGLLTTALGNGHDYARAVALQADGKIVAAGYADNGSTYDFALARYNPNGSPDTTFSGDGLLTTNFGSSDGAYAVALQADGKIVAAGSANNGSNTDFALARYNPDGSLDTTFSGDGLLTTDIGSSDGAYAVALQADGKIVAAGFTYNDSNDNFALARYNSDGSLDTTFSSDGFLTTDFNSGGDVARAVAVQADGKIVAAGSAWSGSNVDFALARYNPDGSLDTTFSGDGLLTTAFGNGIDNVYAVTLQADGKIVTAGYAYTGSNYDFALARYNPDGSLDTTFSGDGLLTTDFGSGIDRAYAVALQVDGRIVAAGYASIVGNPDFALARYNPDGSLDTTFSGDGLLTTAVGSNDYAYAVALQADGKIVSAGYTDISSNRDFALARYTVVDGGSFTYDPNSQFEGLANGETAVETFSYVASDGTLTDTATVTLTINGLNDAPVLAAIGNQSGDELTTISFAAAASDPDLSNTLTFNLDAVAPAGAVIDPLTGTFSWTPTEAQGPGVYPVTVRVTDNGSPALNDFETLNITVNEVNTAPTAVDDSGAGFTTDEDTPFTLGNVLANDSDPESSPLTVLSFDASNLLGQLPWTPTPAGSLDTTFSGDGLLTTAFGNGNGYDYAVAVQADGKIVTAGVAWSGSSQDFALARYNPDGSLDTTFSGDGLLTTAIGSSSDYANAVAVQADGKIVAAGYAYNGSSQDFALARYNPDGSLDTTFSGDGLLITAIGSSSDYASAVAVQADGKIVAAGYAYNGSKHDFALARYNPDGSLDTTFNGDGLLTTDFGSGNDFAYAVAVQADGKVVAAGYTDNGSNRDFALARYNLDGSLDTTFSGDGLLTTAFASGHDFAYAVAVQADGKIVAAGVAWSGSSQDFALARYNPDGSLDTTFSGDGLLTTAVGSSVDYAYAVVLQADGKIVATGYAYGSNKDFALARYNPDGSPDTTFSGDGLLTTDFGSSDGAYAVALQADGKIVAAGYAYNGSNDDSALARYNLDGSLDTTFSGDGLLTTTFGSSTDYAFAVAVQADGKVVAAGYAFNGSYRDFALARYNPNGSLDTTFSGDGLLTTAFGNGYAYAVALQADGKIVAAGYAYNGSNADFALARYNPDGSLDTTFSGDGLLTTAVGSSDDYAYTVALQADGKIVTAGYAYNGHNYDFALARYNPDGSLDTTFSGDGLLTTDFGSSSDYAYAVAVQVDGKIVAAGYANTGGNHDFALARYNPDGSLDTTFSGDGLLTTAVGSNIDLAYAVALQADGKIVAAGYAYNGSNNDFALARYNPNGSLDTTFSDDGLLTTDFGSGIDRAYAVALQVDGRIVAAGYAANGSNNDFAMARYNPDGSLDTTFDTDGLLTTAFASGNEEAHAVAVQADGKIVAAGYAFTDSNSGFALARYTVVDGGSFTYDPNGQFEGLANGETAVETFSYVVSDGTLTDTATVTLTINGLNDAPVLANIGNQSSDELTTISFTAAASDPDLSNTLTFSLDEGAPDGAVIDPVSGAFSWTPTEAQGPGVYPVTVRVTDNGSPTLDDFETFNITVNEINTAPMLDTPDVQVVDELTLLSFTATATDADLPVNSLTFSLDAGALDGAAIDPTTGAFTWTPTEAQGPGLYPVTVRVTDNGSPALNDFETFNITVNEVNNAPTAVDDGGTGFTTDEDTPFPLDDVLANDTDPESDPLTVLSYDASGLIGQLTWTPAPAGSLDITFSGDGLLTTAVGSSSDYARAVAVQADDKIVAAGYAWNGSNYDFALARYTVVDGGSFTYNPNGQFEGLANGETAVETFSYVASDGTLTDTATVTLTINGLNDVPALVAIGNQSGDELTTISFAAAASDPDLSNTLTFSLDAGAPDGAVIDPATGTFTWTPTEAQGPGVYPVTVRVTDNGSPTLDDFETFNITVNEVNVVPGAADDTYTTAEDTILIVSAPGVLANDSDEDLPAQALTAVLDTPPALGELVLAADGSFVYTPALNFNGTVTFTYFANDGVVNSNLALVVITVGPVNDAPVPDAGADQTGSEGQLMQFSGSYTDPGLLSIQTVSITWDFGDGITTTGTLTPTHTYADDGVYTVTLTVDDGEGGVASDTLLVTVENVAPELASIADQSVTINEVLTLTAAYLDPGWLDTHTALVDWGDGFTDTIHLAAGLTGFDFTHVFDTTGVYPVTVTITDDDGGVGQIAFAVTVRKIGHNIWLPIITRH